MRKGFFDPDSLSGIMYPISKNYVFAIELPLTISPPNS